MASHGLFVLHAIALSWGNKVPSLILPDIKYVGTVNCQDRAVWTMQAPLQFSRGTLLQLGLTAGNKLSDDQLQSSCLNLTRA